MRLMYLHNYVWVAIKVIWWIGVNHNMFPKFPLNSLPYNHIMGVSLVNESKFVQPLASPYAATKVHIHHYNCERFTRSHIYEAIRNGI